MKGYFALVLHAHLPFVRHPEHEKFLEENWLFEAITECYLPLIQMLDSWWHDHLEAPLTLTLSPTLCSMLQDPLLQERYRQHLDGLVELADREIHRTEWEPGFQILAELYHRRFQAARDTWQTNNADLISVFRRFQQHGRIEIITCPATHPVLPLLEDPQDIRAQVLTARDHYRRCFDCDPRGIWLPECAYTEAVEPAIAEAGIRWFILDTHGLLQASPRPRYGVFAPVFTPYGLAAFGRDFDSAKQVWSRRDGYPGDPQYRDFYRDVGFDLDLSYVRPYLPSPDHRGFTGVKYYRITGQDGSKAVYDHPAAEATAARHARHFLDARLGQIRQLTEIMGRSPILVAPYDAELFGHWWYEGPAFLDSFVRQAATESSQISLITPGEFLHRHPTHQVGRPSASSWGEEGYWQVWLNETNQWIYPHLRIAQDRMRELARRFPHADGLTARALKQAGRELLLAQASDWPFILRTGTSPDYARSRVTGHLQWFLTLYDQLLSSSINQTQLQDMESRDNLFPDVDWRFWETRE